MDFWDLICEPYEQHHNSLSKKHSTKTTSALEVNIPKWKADDIVGKPGFVNPFEKKHYEVDNGVKDETNKKEFMKV